MRRPSLARRNSGMNEHAGRAAIEHVAFIQIGSPLASEALSGERFQVDGGRLALHQLHDKIGRDGGLGQTIMTMAEGIDDAVVSSGLTDHRQGIGN